MSDCLDEDALVALADGSSSEADRGRAEAHLDVCDDCRRILAALAHDESEPQNDETPTVKAQRLEVTLPGVLASRFVLLRKMSESTLCVAFVARDVVRDELVGVKWIKERWARGSGASQRLRALVTAAQSIPSPNVVHPRESHEVDGCLVVVEELVASDDLAALLRARGIGPEVGRDVVVQMLNALGRAHAHGVPHGHLRTENILVDLAGHVRVSDFGLADALHGAVRTEAERIADDTETASRLALTLLERCGGGFPGLVAILESAVERPEGFPSAVELAAAVDRMVERVPEASGSVGRDRKWMPEVDTLVGQRYRVEGLLGRGGMGAVVSARDLHTGDAVALKLLPPRATRSRAAVERFLREGRAASRVASDHVVKVLEVGHEPGSAPYIVMEHLEGVTLGQLLKSRGALPIVEALHYVIEACIGVAECHAAGIVHRDLKPENLMVLGQPGLDARTKILDFGVSKADWLERAAELRLTGTSEVLGTPTHMSPEQVRSAKSVDTRTDLWALGVILYEALTGRPPFLAANLPALCAAIVSDDPVAPRRHRPDLPAELERVVLACLEKLPDARPFSVRSLAELLTPFASPADRRALTRIRGIAEASVPRISSLPPPPRPTPVPSRPPPPLVSASPSEELGSTDTGQFERGVQRRRATAAVVLATLAACVLVVLWFSFADPPGTATVASANAANTAPPVPGSAEPTPLSVQASSAPDAAPPPGKRRVRNPENPLGTRY